jgi:hypothetical protein
VSPMSAGHSSDVKFEIGHVLFIDVVGYSKLLITEQGELIRGLMLATSSQMSGGKYMIKAASIVRRFVGSNLIQR